EQFSDHSFLLISQSVVSRNLLSFLIAPNLPYTSECLRSKYRMRDHVMTSSDSTGNLDYHPVPIDTSGVTLTTEIEELTELLAKNAHDLWAQQRLTDGWKIGRAHV